MVKHFDFSSEQTADKDYAHFPFTEKDRKACIGKCFRGNIRLSLGLVYTDKEWGKKRKKVLKTPLP